MYTNNLNYSFLQWKDNHWNITYWFVSRLWLPHSVTSQSIKTKPAKNSLVRGIVEIGLNSRGQGQMARHGVLFIFFEGSLTVAGGRGNNTIQESPEEHMVQMRTKINPDV